MFGSVLVEERNSCSHSFIIYSNKIYDVEYLVFGDRRYILVRWCRHTG